jgi:hypothetical protein
MIKIHNFLSFLYTSCKYGATCRYNHPDRYGISTMLKFIISNFLNAYMMHRLIQMSFKCFFLRSLIAEIFVQ